MAWLRTSFLVLIVACLLPLAYAQQSSPSKLNRRSPNPQRPAGAGCDCDGYEYRSLR